MTGISSWLLVHRVTSLSSISFLYPSASLLSSNSPLFLFAFRCPLFPPRTSPRVCHLPSAGATQSVHDTINLTWRMSGPRPEHLDFRRFSSQGQLSIQDGLAELWYYVSHGAEGSSLACHRWRNCTIKSSPLPYHSPSRGRAWWQAAWFGYFPFVAAGNWCTKGFLDETRFLLAGKKKIGREKCPRAHRHTGNNGICQMSMCECVLEYSIDLMKKWREQNQNI